ncbi:hypothetical protein BP6252_10050 [Coleophoma cylindrospora]|uniref:Transposase Tc1-like domain-containing protein n=1 Tax=Coleophoma cylindrospora TaxID=1849047 RepID=A0A3D8QXC6_9HELO|nr:hypothetical protein BP6252_10050 [Coleophoma cylindrospora]
MESPPPPPPPQTPTAQRHELTRDQRLQIKTLFFDAHWSRAEIVQQTGYSYDQVCYALRNRLTPQKRKTGRKSLLNTPQRKRLIEWVTASQENAETPWIEIPARLGLDCGEKAIRTAFKKEGYVRRRSRRKLPLSDKNVNERLD